tara:strand:+ start:86 stop:1033 length:948 start_codon:yes stop_codon:yes gene_type:complete
MNNLVTEPNNNNEIIENYEINLADIFQEIWKKKIFVIIFTSIFAFSSVFYSLGLQDYYQSTALLELAGENDVAPSGAGVSNIAAMAGINLKGVNSDKAQIAKATLDSRDFFKHISSFDGVLEGLLATKEYNPSTKEIIYNEAIYSIENGWVEKDDQGKQLAFTFLEAHKKFDSAVQLSLDFDTSLLTLSVEHQSPVFAYFLADLIVTELNNLERLRAINEATRSRNFLKTELGKTEVLDVRLSINSLIQAQLHREMLANVRENYLLKTLDTPYIPERKSRPGRAIICIVGTFFGFLISIIYVITRQFIFNQKPRA